MEWIDIKKQRPKDGQAILVVYRGKDVGTDLELFAYTDGSCGVWEDWSGSCLEKYGYLEQYGWSGYEWDYDFGVDDITHWMPFPELPSI